jgi:hypothetical protein
MVILMLITIIFEDLKRKLLPSIFPVLYAAYKKLGYHKQMSIRFLLLFGLGKHILYSSFKPLNVYKEKKTFRFTNFGIVFECMIKKNHRNKLSLCCAIKKKMKLYTHTDTNSSKVRILLLLKMLKRKFTLLFKILPVNLSLRANFVISILYAPPAQTDKDSHC